MSTLKPPNSLKATSSLIILNSNDLELVISTNKNPRVFENACRLALETVSGKGKYGIVYDDFNPKKEMIEKVSVRVNKLFVVTDLKLTYCMDCKYSFATRTRGSKYFPTTYLSNEPIPKTDDIFFVKEIGSSASRGVWIGDYDKMKNHRKGNCIVQLSMRNPDLIEGFRYKIRQHVILYEKKCYVIEKSVLVLCQEKFHDATKYSLKANITYPGQTGYFVSDSHKNYDKILENIKLGVEDLARCYQDEINQITENRFLILGLDIVVSDDFNIHIIEINHRPNFKRPQCVESADFEVFAKLISLMVTPN